MNNLNYKKKYLKYKIKYNNLKLYGGDLKADADKKIADIKESSDIKKLCERTKDNCINEEEDIINKCINKIIDFELNYIKPVNSLTEKQKKDYQLEIEKIRNNLYFYKLNIACTIDGKNMYSLTECKKIIDEIKKSNPETNFNDNITTNIVNAATSSVGAVSDLTKSGVGAVSDLTKSGVDAVSSFTKGFMQTFSFPGGALTPAQVKELKDIEKKIDKDVEKVSDLKSIKSSTFFNLLDNFNNLAQSFVSKLYNLGEMTIETIKGFPEYANKKNIIEYKLKILEEKKVFLLKMIKTSKDPLIYEKKLEDINRNIKKTDEDLKDLDSPFKLLTFGLLNKISVIAGNPLESIKEICTNYFLSSSELIEVANDLYNYKSIIERYKAKIPAGHDSYKAKLDNYEQKIINVTTQIKTFITSQIENIHNLNKQIKPSQTPTQTSTQPPTLTPEELVASKAASDNFKLILELSLDPNKVIRQSNKIIDKLNRLFIFIDNNSYPTPFINYENSIISGITSRL